MVQLEFAPSYHDTAVNMLAISSRKLSVFFIW